MHRLRLDRIDDRRGIAGDLFVIKVAGGVAATSTDLEEVYRVTSVARDNTRTMGVAASAGAFPETGEFTFELPEDEIEIGMGLHGEAGVARGKLRSADEIVEFMLDRILGDLPFNAGDDVCVLVNDLGATTMMELLIVNRQVARILERRGIHIHDTLLGSYCTSQEMAGFSISLMKLTPELKGYYDMPAQSISFTKGDPMTIEKLSLDDTRQMFQFVARGIIMEQDVLTQADRAIGDGDHGVGMARGFEAVLAKLESSEFASLGDLFRTVGMALITSIGGAAGAVFGTLFRSGARRLDRMDSFDAQALSSSWKTACWLSRSAAWQNRETRPWSMCSPRSHPVLQYMVSQPLDASLAALVTIAEQAVEDTRHMVATVGKAKTLGERSLGYPDPGAISMLLILKIHAGVSGASLQSAGRWLTITHLIDW